MQILSLELEPGMTLLLLVDKSQEQNWATKISALKKTAELLFFNLKLVDINPCAFFL